MRVVKLNSHNHQSLYSSPPALVLKFINTSNYYLLVKETKTEKPNKSIWVKPTLLKCITGAIV